ncbi:Dam family site-specific DNA-(adenine-N6)-methyltransferase [Aliikangiella maris]|uniref:Site-specific DNA-methyltransferase (adenine-specific) n=2 Tax=Aliikangiella maris TaxID=3162458 RepID=A0ABV3MTQ3_9GAMM
MSNQPTRPFLKWAGGKYRLLEKLTPHLAGKKLIEPFVGSGAVFLNLNFERYLLGDINPDLINLYQCLKKERGQFIRYARSFFIPENNSQAAYLAFRSEFNGDVKGRRRAALFIYLNRHGYNGLCRYNQSGGFNVPFGRYAKPYFPEKEMQHFIKMAKNAMFVCGDYAALMNRARQGDIVYCDPPYVPLSVTASFTSYSKHTFCLNTQANLAAKSAHLANRGVKVVISNHDNEFTRFIYRDAKIESFKVQRFISCAGHNRTSARELIAVYE